MLNFTIPFQIQFENRFDVSELQAQFLSGRLKENPIDLYVVSVPVACQNCPLHKTRLGCTQCSRYC